MHSLLAVTTLLLPSTLAAGLYSKSSPVIQVTGQSYDSLIARSNHTSIVEFYAPWCGHCKNLQPAFEKAAKSLSGLAKVAAVNCDEEANKPFCGSMGVQGFPTLKIVRPGKKAGRPNVEDYQGARTAKGIVDAVVDKIPNHVARLRDGEVEGWVEKGGPKAILFSDKGTVSALLKALAIDFLGVIDVAQVRGKEKGVVTEYAVTKFPTLVLLPGDGKGPIKYDGEMKKEPMVAFLSQAASPNPDPAPKKAKASSAGKKEKKSSSKASSSFSKASASHESADSASARATQTSETLEDNSNPTESPSPEVSPDSDKKPADLPAIAPPITSLPDGLSLQQKCLNDKSGTCILALLSEDTAQFDQGIGQDPTTEVVGALSEIHAKHEAAKRKLFPFYQIPSANSQAAALRKLLNLGKDIELVAINGKRGWYRHYISDSLAHKDLENWIDEIRMGDGAKSKLPTGLIMPADQLPQEPVVHETPESATESANAYESVKAQTEGMVVDENDIEGMTEQLRKQMPEGVDFEFEEIDDEEYERMMREAGEKAAKGEEDGHDEL